MKGPCPWIACVSPPIHLSNRHIQPQPSNGTRAEAQNQLTSEEELLKLADERSNIMTGPAGISPIVRAYLFQMPYYAVWIIGICLCLSRWQRHPKVCAVAMVGFSLLFVESLIGTLFSSYLLPQMLRGSDGRDIWTYYLVWIIRSVIRAGFWSLILVAIFGWRDNGRYDMGEHASYPDN